ncbi:MAG TPA: Ig-like domain-containing protein [Patescibacteria group bacterium]|nr:Ig-like domain-containing protein [Patescibacteria group bacterium]
MKSRLNRTTESKTKKQLIISIVGIVVLLFVLFKFGIPALTNLSLFLSSKNSSSQDSASSSHAVVPPPVMNEQFSATNSASITVNGTAASKTTVQLFVNSSLIDSQSVKDDGTFSFTGVNLTQQQNTIQTKAKTDKAISNFSDTWTITYLQKAPSLSVDSPHDNDSFDSSHPTVVVSGKTDPDNRVTVNGFWAIVDSSGNYSYTLALQNGDNHIDVVATDAAGNTTKQSLTVHHAQ